MGFGNLVLNGFSCDYFPQVLKGELGRRGNQQALEEVLKIIYGKRAFIAGVADDNGYGWPIAKSLAAAGAEVLLGTWVSALNIFETSLRRGKFDESRVLPNGSLMEVAKIYALDGVYDSPQDVPEDIKSNKRYAGASNWTVKEELKKINL